MTFFNEFNNLVSKVSKELRIVTKRLKSCPEGNLMCAKNGKKYIFYEDSYINGIRNRVSLTGNDNAQVRLAFKACLLSDYTVLIKAKEILTRAKEDLEKLFLKSTPYAPANAAKGDVLSLSISTNEWHEYYLKDKYPMLSPKVLSTAVDLLNTGYAWMKQNYPSNSTPFNPTENFITSNNIRVRSRVEMLITEMLLQRGLAFRYECAYEIGWQTFYPDFTIMNPRTGELYYLEYFGMMDDPDYYAKAMRKIAAYQSSPDANRFIFIFESAEAPFDSQQIENVLDRYFMQ